MRYRLALAELAGFQRDRYNSPENSRAKPKAIFLSGFFAGCNCTTTKRGSYRGHSSVSSAAQQSGSRFLPSPVPV